MARRFENEKGFLIIEMSPEEAKSLNFGLLEGCVCMHCNSICTDNVYYVSALNDTMCKKCLKEWLRGATRYSDDIPYEIDHYIYYSKKLGLV